MGPKISLHINKPCQEDWSKMKMHGKGRHCDLCNKIVTDFSLWSDKQIIAFLKQSHADICGRLQPHQLDRPLDPNTSNGKKTKLKLVFTFLTSLWIGTSARAQGGATIKQKSPTAKEAKRSQLHQVSFSNEYRLLLSGSVKDKRGNAISGADLSINGMTCCITDSLGNFDLGKTIILKEDSIDVAISALGYATIFVKQPVNDHTKMNIVLNDVDIAAPDQEYDLGSMLRGSVGGISIERRSFVGRCISSIKSFITKI